MRTAQFARPAMPNSELPMNEASDASETTAHDAMFERASAIFAEVQTSICEALSQVERANGGSGQFTRDSWDRPGGGGGVARVIEGGAVFEKAGVNWSNVDGELPESVAAEMPGTGRRFRASGVSLVIHPRSPRVPTTHANFRMFVQGDRAWFGGGADLTPYYLEPDDARHFHQTFATVCDAHPQAGSYREFKDWCDRYFFLPHRGETRGVGGIFYDWLGAKPEQDLAATFEFVQAAAAAFVPAYVPIVERRLSLAYGEAERRWQLQRRGRYVEFNLVYDRGTLFGLKTGGRIESVLMSLPPEVRWDYDVVAADGSPEAALVNALKPTDWLGRV